MIYAIFAEVNLDDVNPVAFTNVLRFIYTDEVVVDAATVLPTLYVAKKYAITAMENACVDFLSQAITVDNAFMLLAQANYFDESELAQKCLEVMIWNIPCFSVKHRWQGSIPGWRTNLISTGLSPQPDKYQ